MAQIIGGFLRRPTSPRSAARFRAKILCCNDPYWKPFFDGYDKAREWLLHARNPDVAVVYDNDHGLNFFLDKLPTFAIGAAFEYPAMPTKAGAFPQSRPFQGDPELSWHIIQFRFSRGLRPDHLPGNARRSRIHCADVPVLERPRHLWQCQNHPGVPLTPCNIRCLHPRAATNWARQWAGLSQSYPKGFEGGGSGNRWNVPPTGWRACRVHQQGFRPHVSWMRW